MLLLIAAIGTTWMACDEGRQAFTPPRGPFSLHPLVALVLGFVSGPPAGPLREFVQMARKQQAEQQAEHRRQREEEERRDRVMANEILRYREALRLLAKAIGWADVGAPFGLIGPGPLLASEAHQG